MLLNIHAEALRGSKLLWSVVVDSCTTNTKAESVSAQLRHNNGADLPKN